MKANEAPERIWIDNLDEGFWFDSPSSNKSIEYIRKDVSIKNTCEWIKMMWSETDDRFKEDYTGMLIEIFKNYMKGE